MQNIKLLTVLIPTYNRANELKQTLKSFIQNKDRKICFLIINNNSTDSTIKIVNLFKKQDKRIKLINNKKNLGFSKSLKIGLKKISTPFCTILSDRYKLKGNYLKSVIKIFSNNDNVNIIHHSGEGNIKKYKKKYKIYKVGLESSIKAFQLSPFISGLSFRKNLINLNKFPKKNNAIYSHLFPIISLTKKGKFAQIFNCKFELLNKKKILNKKFEKEYMKYLISRQSRPLDFGIYEIAEYIHRSNLGTYSKMAILQKKLFWFCNITKKLPKENFRYTLKKTEKVIGNYFVFYYLYLIFYRFDVALVKLIINKIIFVKYYKNHMIALLLFFATVYKKLLTT